MKPSVPTKPEGAADEVSLPEAEPALPSDIKQWLERWGIRLPATAEE